MRKEECNIRACPYLQEKNSFHRAVDDYQQMHREYRGVEKAVLYSIFDKMSILKVDTYPRSLTYTFEDSKITFGDYPSYRKEPTSIDFFCQWCRKEN